MKFSAISDISHLGSQRQAIAKEWQHSEIHYWTVLMMLCFKCSWKHFFFCSFSPSHFQYKTIFQLCARDKKKRKRKETRQRGEEKCLFYDMGLSSRTTLNMWLKQNRWEKERAKERGNKQGERVSHVSSKRVNFKSSVLLKITY